MTARPTLLTVALCASACSSAPPPAPPLAPSPPRDPTFAERAQRTSAYEEAVLPLLEALKVVTGFAIPEGTCEALDALAHEACGNAAAMQALWEKDPSKDALILTELNVAHSTCNLANHGQNRCTDLLVPDLYQREPPTCYPHPWRPSSLLRP